MRRFLMPVVVVSVAMALAGCGDKSASGAAAPPRSTSTVAAKVTRHSGPAWAACDAYAAKQNPASKMKAVGAVPSSAAEAVAAANRDMAGRAAVAGYAGSPSMIKTPDALLGREDQAGTLCYLTGRFAVSTPPGVEPPDLSVVIVIDGYGYPLFWTFSKDPTGHPKLDMS